MQSSVCKPAAEGREMGRVLELSDQPTPIKSVSHSSALSSKAGRHRTFNSDIRMHAHMDLCTSTSNTGRHHMCAHICTCACIYRDPRSLITLHFSTLFTETSLSLKPEHLSPSYWSWESAVLASRLLGLQEAAVPA